MASHSLPMLIEYLNLIVCCESCVKHDIMKHAYGLENKAEYLNAPPVAWAQIAWQTPDLGRVKFEHHHFQQVSTRLGNQSLHTVVPLVKFEFRVQTKSRSIERSKPLPSSWCISGTPRRCAKQHQLANGFSAHPFNEAPTCYGFSIMIRRLSAKSFRRQELLETVTV